MLQQAIDLREEGDELFGLLDGLSPADWQRPTPFKQWTVNQVVDHLHSTDRVAVLSLQDPDAFVAMAQGQARAARARSAAKRSSASDSASDSAGDPASDSASDSAGDSASDSVAAATAPPAKPVGRELLAVWREYFLRMCDLLGAADPEARLKWFGPDMGVRMFTTARQMETWAHGQDVYDLLRVPRRNTDRLKNIAVIGVRTFGWTFVNRKLAVPGDAPYVQLTAPSGAIWEWGTPDDGNCVTGSAVEFCHVVTQGRNIADTRLHVAGAAATQWMAIAQCFAGPPENPPAPGTRGGQPG